MEIDSKCPLLANDTPKAGFFKPPVATPGGLPLFLNAGPSQLFKPL
jgi:hypothetical protein